MKRPTLLLLVLAGVLTVALYWVLGHRPQQEELADVRAQIDAQHAMQADLQAQLARLREVRSTAPEIEAELAAAEAVLPDSAALPALLRQLQTAADEAGVALQTITAGQPSAVAESTEPLTAIAVNLELRGRYFQAVDFLRRLEDPAITPRGVLWQSATVTRDAYPELVVTLGATVFAQEPAPVEVPTADAPTDAPGAPTDAPEAPTVGDDLDLDLDLDTGADA